MTYAEARISLQLEAEIEVGSPMRAETRRARAEEDAAAMRVAAHAQQQQEGR